MHTKRNSQGLFRLKNAHLFVLVWLIAFVPGVLSAQTLEEVVVTAQKRSEDLQDVGAAVSALTSDEMARLRVREGRDLFERLPNVSLMSNGTETQLQVNMRGIGYPSFSPIAVQPVGLFADEVNWNSPNIAGLFLFDLERVEVVRGPQNTLYG
jgi:iron complex outermembrane receptor protein